MIKSSRERALEQRRLFEDSYEELDKNIFRDIKSFWIEHYRSLSDKEIENIENVEDTPFLDKVISFLIRECGHTIEDVYDEYGISEIKGLLSDFAMYGYDHVTPTTILENKQKSSCISKVNSMNKTLEQRISKLESQLCKYDSYKVLKESYQKEEGMIVVKTAKVCELVDSMIDDMYADGSNEKADNWLKILDELRSLKSKMENLTYHT